MTPGTAIQRRPEERDMELFIFARFHARPGNEGAVADALRDTVAPSSEEPGCLSIHAFDRFATRDCSTSIRAGETKRRSSITPACRIRCASSSACSR